MNPPGTPTGAAIGGYARSAALSPERRSEIARNAAIARSASMSPERRREICIAANAAKRRGWLPKTPPGGAL